MPCREQILSDETYDYITNLSMDVAGISDPSLCYHQIDNLFTLLYLPRDRYPDMRSNFYPFQSIPKLFGLMQLDSSGDPAASSLTQPVFDPLALSISGITSISGPPLSLTGAGVLIAIIDTGVNFADPVFQDENGRSKILSIWDQTLEDDSPPEGFAFGSEFTEEQINEAIRSGTPYQMIPSRDPYNHGTVMASLAAGSELPTGYVGAAKDASLIVVKCKEAKANLKDYYLVPQQAVCYQENDLMLAIQYCERFAAQKRMPLVVCLGMGTNMGDHSGSLFLGQYLNYVANIRERAVVVCGGNEGNAGHHFQGSTKEGPVNVEIRVDNNVNGFMLEFWGDLPDIFTLGIRSPGGENIPSVPLYASQSIQYDFVFEPTRITVDNSLVESSSGRQLVRVRMEKPTPGIWTLLVDNMGAVQNGGFQMYLPITELLSAPVYFLTPSPDITLTEPSLAEDVFSVTAYNPANQSIAVFSGRGYSSNGRIRPDFAAPGVDVATISGRRSGSSIGAALTAGALAQFYQWAVVEGNNPYVKSREVKSFFLRGATRQTGLTYPNRQWGFGQLNIQGAFERMR